MVDAQESGIEKGDRFATVETPRDESDAKLEKNEYGLGEYEKKPFGKLPETPSKEKNSDAEKKLARKTSSDVPPQRSGEKWSNGYEGAITALAYISSVGSLWRFPEMLLKHGGSFVVQFTIAYLAVGMPLLYAEMAIGQYTSCNHYGVFNHISPIFTGVASCMTFILIVRSCVISVIQATTFAFLVATFHGNQDEDGESQCLQNTHSPQCFNVVFLKRCLLKERNFSEECDRLERVSLLSGAVQLRRTPFFDHVLTEFNVLPQESSEYTWPHFQLFLSLLFVWFLIGVVCFFGTKLLAKISHLMIIPILVFFCLMIFGFATIKGSSKSLRAFFFRSFKFDWSKLEDFNGVWTDAVSLVIFSLNLGNGGLIKLASNNDFGYNFTRNVKVISIYGYLFNYLTTLTILPYIYFVSSEIYGNDAGRAMQMWVDHGDFGLMNVIAETITSQYSHRWLCVLYFLACFILELESTTISMYVVCSSLLDRINSNSHPILVRMITIILLSGAALFTSLFLITPGIYAIKQVDRFFTIATILTSFVQICVFMHVYGFKRFIINVRTMRGGTGPVSTFWWISWILFTPIVLLAAFFTECVYFARDEISIGNLVLTSKFKNFSWIIFVSCVLFLPAAAFYRIVCIYNGNEKKAKLFKITPEWGPAEETPREDAKYNERAMRVR